MLCRCHFCMSLFKTNQKHRQDPKKNPLRKPLLKADAVVPWLERTTGRSKELQRPVCMLVSNFWTVGAVFSLVMLAPLDQTPLLSLPCITLLRSHRNVFCHEEGRIRPFQHQQRGQRDCEEPIENDFGIFDFISNKRKRNFSNKPPNRNRRRAEVSSFYVCFNLFNS